MNFKSAYFLILIHIAHVNVIWCRFDLSDLVKNIDSPPSNLNGTSFTWKSCGSDSTDTIKIKNLFIEPNLITPGRSISISLDAEVLEKLESPMKLVMEVRKTLFGRFPVKIPCLNVGESKVGSCTYEDVCSLIPKDLKSCPLKPVVRGDEEEDDDEDEEEAACACPVQVGKYSVNKFKLEIPSEMPSGEYSITTQFFNKKEKAIGCMAIEIKVE